jgi:hypothetical protein
MLRDATVLGAVLKISWPFDGGAAAPPYQYSVGQSCCSAQIPWEVRGYSFCETAMVLGSTVA